MKNKLWRVFFTLFLFMMQDNIFSEPNKQDTIWVVGNYNYFEQQRITDDNQMSALVQDQHFGNISIVFESQKAYIEKYGSMRPQQYQFMEQSNKKEIPSFPMPIEAHNYENYSVGTIALLKGKFIHQKVKAVGYGFKDEGKQKHKGKPNSFTEYDREVSYFLAEDQPVILPTIHFKKDEKNQVLVEWDWSKVPKEFGEVKASFLVTVEDSKEEFSGIKIIPGAKLQTVLPVKKKITGSISVEINSKEKPNRLIDIKTLSISL